MASIKLVTIRPKPGETYADLKLPPGLYEVDLRTPTWAPVFDSQKDVRIPFGSYTFEHVASRHQSGSDISTMRFRIIEERRDMSDSAIQEAGFGQMLELAMNRVLPILLSIFVVGQLVKLVVELRKFAEVPTVGIGLAVLAGGGAFALAKGK